MKKLILTSLIAFICVASFSQITENLNFGIRAGYASSQLSNLDDNAEGIMFPQGALFAGYTLKDGLDLIVEANYFRHGYDNDNGSSLYANYLGVPLMLKRTTESGLFLFLGLEVAGRFSSEEERVAIIEGNQIINPFMNLKNIIFTRPVGIGFNFSESLFIEGRWNKGLTSIAENYDYSPNLYSVSLGYNF